MIDLLKDDSLAQQLEQDGYVVIPFATATQVEQLQRLYANVPSDPEAPFWSSSFLTDTSFKQDLTRSATQILKESIESVLAEHRPLGCSFLTKLPGAYSEMPIHQDWTVVDESKYGSFTIWMPLQDTGPENGAMQVIPGSHRFNSVLRSPSLPVAFELVRKQLRAYLVDVPLRAGEAILFNHALMHASPANRTKDARVAVTYGLVPTAADLFMYYGTEKGTVKKYKMPDDMFIKYPEIRNQPLIGEFADEFEYQVIEMTMADIEQKLGVPRSQMIPLFKDPDLQAQFEQNGFVKVQALDQEQVEQLLQLHAELGLTDEKGYGFHVGMDNRDKQLVANMVNRIKEVAMPKVEGLLTGAQVFTASFVIKEPNPQGVVPPHQDWSFVEDEKKHCSVTCWIPLLDVNMQNGCLGVIKGSNRFFSNVRPSPSPQVETPLKKHMYTIFPYLQLVEMKAGEALIFDNRTFHASPPNTTDNPRIAVGLGFTQADAQIRHYYLKPGTTDTLLKYKIDPEFFLKYDNQRLSEMYDKGEVIEGYELLGEVPYRWEDLSADEMRQLMESAGNTFNAPLVETMTKLFVQSPPPEEPEPKNEPEPDPQAVSEPQQQQGDGRSFWETYSPMNIIREVRYRLTGKA